MPATILQQSPTDHFVIFYTEQYETRVEARLGEKYLMGGSGKKLLKSLWNTAQENLK
jgi:hypothetical protein